VRTNSTLLLLVVAIAVPACRQQEEPTASAAGTSTSKPSSSGAAQRGIDAPGSDGAVVDLARKAMACEWSEADGLSRTCPAVQDWTRRELWANGKADATLLTTDDRSTERPRCPSRTIDRPNGLDAPAGVRGKVHDVPA
jgi:hypothetical protein